MNHIPSGLLHRLELPFVLLLSWLLFVSLPVQRGGIGLSWDTLNHHIYLGWVASSARFDKDYFAAASQSYQFPYLYWPIYMMAKWRFAGWQAGVVWASLHALISMPLWSICRALIQGSTWLATFFRISGVLLGLGSILIIRAPETTGNDGLAALPYLCALAVAAKGLPAGARVAPDVWRRAVIVGLLGGGAVALKLSNGPLVPLLPLLCAAFLPGWTSRLALMFVCGLAILVGFWLVYGWWGWQLWQQFGNPVFPFADGLFEPLRLMFWHSPEVAR